MKKKLTILYFNVALFCVLIVVTEISGQLVYFFVQGYPVFERYKHRLHGEIFEIHPYLVGRLRKKITVEHNNITITSTDFHTRYTGAPESDEKLVRVAILGGSTAFGSEVTDRDSWPTLLQNMLGDHYSVINYGMPGYSTVEAIIQMSLIVPEKKPHIVIFYEGWNDIRNYHDEKLGPDYYNHGMNQYNNLGIQTLYKDDSLFQRLFEISAISRFAGLMHRKLLEKYPGLSTSAVYVNPDPYVDRLYLRNLKTLMVLSRSTNAHTLFVPQVINYADYRGSEQSRPWTPHIMDDAMPILLDRFNSIMKEVCVPEEPDCKVVNEVLKEDWNNSDFVDDGHFSRAGGMKFAKIIADHIRMSKKAKINK